MYLDPKVWGPHYWFFLHTIAMTYPEHPNEVTMKKYYEFIQNLPLFIPVEKISAEFCELLDRYPVQPYLTNRDSFVQWINFIHNKINEKLEKPTLSLQEFMEEYKAQYKSDYERNYEYMKMREKIIYSCILASIGVGIYYFYNK